MEIKAIRLQSNAIEKTKEFYINRLGFALVMEDSTSFTFQAGNGEVTFSSKDVDSAPYYHFAFNIPSNQFVEAKAWTKERVKLLVEDGLDEVEFSHISAHALYFSDPSGNIVEFISRHAISEKRIEPFSVNSILTISEIGLIVENTVAAAEKLAEIGVLERDNKEISRDFLNFMGARNKGIFIILAQPERRWFFSDKKSAVFPLQITLQSNDQIIVRQNSEIEIVRLSSS